LLHFETILTFFSSRETHKIGLLYVAPGQEELKDILKNEKGSDLYSEFTQGVGWTVDLNAHLGYSGGLDRSLKIAPYYCSPTIELMCMFDFFWSGVNRG
jgi:hypothetical protein